MKRKFNSFAAAVMAACVCITMSACGGSGTSEKDIEKKLEQLDKMSAEDAEREIEKGLEALDEDSAASEDPQAAAAAEYLAEKIYSSAQGYINRISIDGKPVPDFNEIKYELLEEKSGKLETEINGKKKKIKWNLDEADVYGEVKDYMVKYVTVTVDGVSCTYPEGADQLEIVNAFENLTVTFSGTAPQSKVSISGGNSLCKYTADVESGVFNGDVVTVSAEFKSPQEDKTLSEEKKEYTVEGLLEYAVKLSDIPEESLDKIRSQGEDTIKAEMTSWKEGMKMDSLEFSGYYFLSAKEGFTPSAFNRIYCVYKISTTVTGQKPGEEGDRNVGHEEYYTYFTLDNITLLPDGICSFDLSKGKMTTNKIKSGYGYNDGWGSSYYKYTGYSDLDSMFNYCVTSNIDKYNYESTVK